MEGALGEPLVAKIANYFSRVGFAIAVSWLEYAVPVDRP